MRDVAIKGDMIRLGQLLQVAGFVGSGAEAKVWLTEHEAMVNGEPENRRGRQLHKGDIVETPGAESVRLV